MSVDPFGTIRAKIIDLQGNAVGGQPSNNDWRISVDAEQLKFQHYDSSANSGAGAFITRQSFGTGLTGVNVNPVGTYSVSGNLQISEDFSVDGGTLFVDASTNRVGFGTLTPSEAVHIVGNAYIDGDITITGSASWNTGTTDWVKNSGTNELTYNVANVGIGTNNPAESLHLGGALIVGTTTGTANGTIRYSGTDFEGYHSGSWKSFTTIPVDWSSMATHIIPSTDNIYDLGSSTKTWRHVYVGPGSLWVNGKQVVTDDSGTITVSTDINQNLSIKTSGTGNVQISAVGTGDIELTAGGVIQVKKTLQILNGQKITSSSGGTVVCANNFQSEGSLRGTSLTLDGSAIISAAELNVLDGVVAGTASASKALILDSSRNITNINDLTMTGNLNVTGTTTTLNSTTIAVGDGMFKYAKDNAADAVDIGWYGPYDVNTGTTKYTGIFRDASDGKFRIFKSTQTEPATTVDITATGYAKADLVVGDVDFTSGTMRGSIIPDTDDAYDIGSAEFKIRDMYVSENSLWIGDEHKVTISGGKMKFRKRKTSVVPAAILAAGGSEAGAKTFASKTSLTSIKLKHWKNYLRQLTGDNTKKVSDVFRDTTDDYEEEQGADAWLESGNNIYLGASGNVGIGDTTPSYKLDVNGTLRCSTFRAGSTNVSETTLGYLNGATSDIQTQLNGKQVNISGGASTIATTNLTANRAIYSNGSGKVAVSVITSTELGYLDGVTNFIQTQLDAKQGSLVGGASTILTTDLATNRALISNGSGKVEVSAVTSTELGYLDGVSSNIQTQLNAKSAAVTGGASTIATSNLTIDRALVSNGSGKVAVSAVTSTEIGYLDGVSSAIQTQLNGKATAVTGGGSTIATSNLTTNRALISNGSGKVAVSDITSTEIGYLDGVTSNIQTQLDTKGATLSGGVSTIVSNNLTASRALVSDSSGKVIVSAVTSTELGYLDGVSSAIQTQINTKQATITGAATTIATSNLTANRALVSDGSGKVVVSDVTSTELGYLDGVSSAIQTQINTKQATITGAATTIATSNLTANRALVSDGSGKVVVSDVTSTELGYLDGVSSNIQTQINNAGGGGGFTVNGSNAYHSGGYVGVNKTNPAERLDINGGVKLGAAAGTANGTIQWTGSELQVRIGGVWKRIGMYGEWDILYAFTTFTFTTCGVTGRYGPTLAQCRASYSPSWTDDTSFFNIVTQGIQEWTVPETASYTIEVWGASGLDVASGPYGNGAKIIGTFSLIKSDIIAILVGQKPTSNSYATGGGGGSFVWKKSTGTPLIIAGGGGGSNNGGGNNSTGHAHGQSGQNGGYSTTQVTVGQGGDEGGGNWAGGGGAGWLSNGVGVSSSNTYAGFGGIRPLEGGLGGGFQDGTYAGDPYGGFGGGGGSGVHIGGGGGGYTGGEGGNYSSKTPDSLGGGGGSYNTGINQTNTAGYRDGEGQVIITKV